MNSLKIEGLGYKQLFTSCTLVDDLSNKLNININSDFISNKSFKKILESF